MGSGRPHSRGLDWHTRRRARGPLPGSAERPCRRLRVCIGKPVVAVPVQRESWNATVPLAGHEKPEPRMRMLDGFNEGWIDFRYGGSKAIKGQTNAITVIASLAASTQT